MPVQTHLPILPRTIAELIIHAACQYYNITDQELKTRDRVNERKIVYYLMRTETQMNYAKITKRFGYKDPSWTMEVVSEISSIKDIYPHISRDIKKIMEIVNTLV